MCPILDSLVLIQYVSDDLRTWFEYGTYLLLLTKLNKSALVQNNNVVVCSINFNQFNFKKPLNASDAFKRSMMSISSLASHCLLNIMITK